jgi:hypothetical protein
MADRTEKSNNRAEDKGGMRYRKKRGWHRERKSPIIVLKRYSRDEIETRKRMADRTEKSNYRAEDTGGMRYRKKRGMADRTEKSNYRAKEKGGMRYRKKRGWHRERKSPIIELKIKEG